ncbi:MAG: carboxypeptidase-like regulatory domain-containing protein [Thermoplasmata archaeon]
MRDKIGLRLSSLTEGKRARNDKKNTTRMEKAAYIGVSGLVVLMFLLYALSGLYKGYTTGSDNSLSDSRITNVAVAGDMSGSRADDPPHNLTFFLHTVQANESAKYYTPQFSVVNYFDTTLSFSAGEAESVWGIEQFMVQWYMYPPLTSPLNLSGADFIIWIFGSVATGQPNFAGSLSIYEVTESNISSLDFNGTLRYYVNIPSNTPLYQNPTSPMVFHLSGNHVFASGSVLRLVMWINPGSSGGGAQRTNVSLAWDEAHRYDSRLVLYANNPLTINETYTCNAEGVPSNSFIKEGNTTLWILANLTDPVGLYDIASVNLTIYNSTMSVVPGYSSVPLPLINGSNTSSYYIYGLEINYTTLSEGVYYYRIQAVDNSGITYCYYFSLNTTSPYDENKTGVFAIGVLSQVNLHLVDSLGYSLAGAGISAGGQAVLSDSNGNATFYLYGSTLVQVFWKGAIVFSEVLNISNDTTLDIICGVFYPEIVLVDSRNNTVQDATIFFATPDGVELPPLFTDANGSTGVLDKIPLGNSSISAWYRGKMVFNGTVMIDSNSVVYIDSDIYYLEVTPKDPWGNILPLATVVVKDSATAILLDSRAVSSEGTAVSVLPAGRYNVEVWWHGCPVAEVKNITLYQDMAISPVADVLRVNITLVDLRGYPVAGAHIVLRSSTEVALSEIADTSGNLSAVLPAGTFALEVFWNSFPVNSSVITIGASTDYTIVCNIGYFNFLACDSRDYPVRASISIYASSTGVAIASGTADDTGRITFRLAEGNYILSAAWEGIIVNTTLVELTPASDGSDTTVRINCSIYYVAFEAIDTMGNTVENLTIYLTGSGNPVARTILQDPLTGSYPAVRVPAGAYSIDCYWLGLKVNSSTAIQVYSDKLVVINCSIFYVNVDVLDVQAQKVSDASVYVFTKGFITDISITPSPDKQKALITNKTDAAGSTLLRLPAAEFTLWTEWLGIPVNLTIINVTALLEGKDLGSVLSFVINGTIYHVSFKTSDDQDIPVSQASTTVYIGLTPVYSGLTGNDGMISLRLPAYNVTVVSSWQGVLVFEGSININRSGEYILKCTIYYPKIAPLDSRSLVIDGAAVRVYSHTGTLLGAGVSGKEYAVLRLPAGEWSVEITWQFVNVATALLNITDSGLYKVNTSVIYATLIPVDRKNITLSNATVIIASQFGINAAGTTTDMGYEVRVPEGAYNISVAWKGNPVHTGRWELKDCANVWIECSVMYLEIKAKDRNGNLLDGVLVYVRRNGTLYAESLNTTNGSCTFRLPEGEYSVEARLVAKDWKTHVDISLVEPVLLRQNVTASGTGAGTMTVEFTFSDYPLRFYSTNGFWIAVLIILLILLAAVSAIWIIKHK